MHNDSVFNSLKQGVGLGSQEKNSRLGVKVGNQTPPPVERFEKLEYTSSEEERTRKVLRVKVAHPAILNHYTDVETHVKQFFAQQLKISRREIDDGIHVAKLPQLNTVLFKLSDHRLIFFCSIPKNSNFLEMTSRWA